jgi:hypothetical protein
MEILGKTGGKWSLRNADLYFRIVEEISLLRAGWKGYFLFISKQKRHSRLGNALINPNAQTDYASCISCHVTALPA